MRIRTIGGIFIILCAAISLSCACCGKNNKSGSASTNLKTNIPIPVQYTYKIKNVYPHATTSFTQGLYWSNGYLWESTGLESKSKLLKVELETGKILQSVSLDDRYFAEGVALYDDKIYQLTWKNRAVLVYDAVTLEQITTFRNAGEGWGLTTDGKYLYMSEGSAKIFVIDPIDFSRKSSITVREGRKIQQMINELEWIEGKIWANVYFSEKILIIDPGTGNVEGIIDLQGILPITDMTPNTDVLNGIAYDPEQKRIFITGKNWPKLFEIEIVKK